MLTVSLFGVGVLLFVTGLASNYLASLIPAPRQAFPLPRLLAAGGVLALMSGLIVVIQDKVGSEQSPSAVVPPAATTTTPAVRQPSQWASEVEAICAPMVPALEQDLAALRAVDQGRVQANDKQEIAKLVSALRGFHDHYATLARRIHDVEPPTYSAEAVREWLRLFDERGQKLYAGIEKLESGGILDRLQSAFAMSEYGDDTDLVLAKAKQLGVESCP